MNETKENLNQTPLRVIEKPVSTSRLELKNRFDVLKDKEPTIEKTNKILTETMNTMQSETQKSIIKRRTENTEIESLDTKRIDL